MKIQKRFWQKYFNGFCLKNEEKFFDFIKNGEYSVVGFSFGAIGAFEFAKKNVIKNLILISPAFFENRSLELKKKEIENFYKNKSVYLRKFLKNIAYPCKISLHTLLDNNCTVQELKKLLFYKWKEEEFKLLEEKGVNIEVYIGERDKIIDAQAAFNFFSKVATVYFFKKRGHLLIEC